MLPHDQQNQSTQGMLCRQNRVRWKAKPRITPVAMIPSSSVKKIHSQEESLGSEIEAYQKELGPDLVSRHVPLFSLFGRKDVKKNSATTLDDSCSRWDVNKNRRIDDDWLDRVLPEEVSSPRDWANFSLQEHSCALSNDEFAVVTRNQVKCKPLKNKMNNSKSRGQHDELVSLNKTDDFVVRNQRKHRQLASLEKPVTQSFVHSMDDTWAQCCFTGTLASTKTRPLTGSGRSQAQQHGLAHKQGTVATRTKPCTDPKSTTAEAGSVKRATNRVGEEGEGSGIWSKRAVQLLCELSWSNSESSKSSQASAEQTLIDKKKLKKHFAVSEFKFEPDLFQDSWEKNQTMDSNVRSKPFRRLPFLATKRKLGKSHAAPAESASPEKLPFLQLVIPKLTSRRTCARCDDNISDITDEEYSAPDDFSFLPSDDSPSTVDWDYQDLD